MRHEHLGPFAVNASHIGLVVNPDVYRHIGAALASSPTAVDVDFE